MKLLGMLLLALGFSQCASVKFDKEPPFKTNGATYENYVGGMPGVSGIWLRVEIETTSEIEFKQAYFNSKVAKIEIQESIGKTYASAHFNTSTVNSKEDLVLHSNGKKEYGNTPPSEDFPFELKENEAVLSYLKKGKLYHLKIENIQKKNTQYMPQKQ